MRIFGPQCDVTYLPEAVLGPGPYGDYGRPVDHDVVMEAINREVQKRRCNMLRCKFRVDQIIREGQGRRLTLTASNQKDGDNKDWSQWTPSGQMSIYVTNPPAMEKIDAMNPGDHLWIDLSLVQG